MLELAVPNPNRGYDFTLWQHGNPLSTPGHYPGLVSDSHSTLKTDKHEGSRSGSQRYLGRCSK